MPTKTMPRTAATPAFDSAEQGINQRLADGLELTGVEPLVPGGEPGQGAGRYGKLKAKMSLADLTARVKRLLKIENAQAVGPLDARVQTVAGACGSAGEFLAPAHAAGEQRSRGERTETRSAVSSPPALH